MHTGNVEVMHTGSDAYRGGGGGGQLGVSKM